MEDFGSESLDIKLLPLANVWVFANEVFASEKAIGIFSDYQRKAEALMLEHRPSASA